tara:strand:- start:791 stop:1723 length:933 start_codon:yes stop_codon:yes gene_type:complete
MRRRSRTLSQEGLDLFSLAYKKNPSKSKIKKFLSCIFYSEDDKLVDELTKQCRQSSEHLIANVDHGDLSSWVDNFVQNIIILIMKNEDKIAKYHVAKKNYYLYLTVAKRALKNNDHNTAWLLLHSFVNKSIVDFNFKRGKDFINSCTSLYGDTNNCFQNHALDVATMYGTESNIKKREYIPSAAVLNMYCKKMHNYHKTYEDLGIKKNQKNTLQHIENVVSKYKLHYREAQMHENQLMPLYKNVTTVPGFEDQDKVAFGDLITISKQINNTRKKRNRVHPAPNPALKRTEEREWHYNPTYKNHNKNTKPN